MLDDIISAIKGSDIYKTAHTMMSKREFDMEWKKLYDRLESLLNKKGE